MPYADLERPSLALGLLQARLLERGIACRVVYANLMFAEQTGLEPLTQLRRVPEHLLAGEWTFARAAFPEHPDPPGFLRQLAQRHGQAVDLEPLRPQAEALIARLAQELSHPEVAVVGCSSTFQQHCASLALLRRLKSLRPDLMTVMGGANCEGEMGQETLRAFPWLDVVVSGEADDLFPELVERWLDGHSMESLPYGALSRAAPVASPPPRARAGALDQLPYPDFSDYFEALETSPLRAAIQPGLVLESSRGCWWGQKHHCTFCGLNGQAMGYRSKSGPRLLDELDALTARHRLTSVEMVDNILDMRGFQTFLPELAKREPPLSLFYEVKANLTRPQLQLLQQAGVGWVQPGIESLDDRILDLLDKGTTALQNIRFLRLARELGIRVSWLILCRVPGEQDAWYQDMARWLPWLSHLQPPTRAVPVRYDRFSPYQRQPERYGLQLIPDPSYRYVYPQHVDLAKLAYFFTDAPATRPLGREPDQKRPGLKAFEAEVSRWCARFWRWPELLCQSDHGSHLEILDTRRVADQRRYRLSGISRELLLACDSPRSTEKLQQQFGPSTLEQLRQLERRKVVLELGGRWLALAVPGRVPRLPERDRFPGGRTLAQAEL